MSRKDSEEVDIVWLWCGNVACVATNRFVLGRFGCLRRVESEEVDLAGLWFENVVCVVANRSVLGKIWSSQ